MDNKVNQTPAISLESWSEMTVSSPAAVLQVALRKDVSSWHQLDMI